MSKKTETPPNINYTSSPFSPGDRSVGLKDFDPQRDVRVVPNNGVDSHFFSSDNLKDIYHLQDKLPPLMWNTYSDDDLGDIARLVRMYERVINNLDETRVSHKWHEVATIAVAGALIGAIPGAALHYTSHLNGKPAEWIKHGTEVITAAGILVGMHIADKLSEPEYTQKTSPEINELLRQARDQAKKLDGVKDIAQLTELYERSINDINERHTPHAWYEVAAISVAGALIGAIPGAALHYSGSNFFGEPPWLHQATEVVTAAGILVGMHVADKLLEPEHVKKTSHETAELLRQARDQARKSFAETVYEEKKTASDIEKVQIPEGATAAQLEARLKELRAQEETRNKLENIPNATTSTTPENKITSFKKQEVQPLVEIHPEAKRTVSV